jgi:hypothetical protein
VRRSLNKIKIRKIKTQKHAYACPRGAMKKKNKNMKHAYGLYACFEGVFRGCGAGASAGAGVGAGAAGAVLVLVLAQVLALLVLVLERRVGVDADRRVMGAGCRSNKKNEK